MKKIVAFLKNKKYYIIAGILILGISGYFIYQKYFVATGTVRYVTSKVERGNLVSSISGTGQISFSDQVDIKAKGSGDIIYVGVKVGAEVKKGTLIAQIDSADAEKSVRDAEQNLVSAKLSLTKLTQPADALTLLQSENSLAQAQESKINSEEDLSKAYDDGFTEIDNVFLDLPGVMSGIQSLLYGNDFSNSQSNIDWYNNTGTSYDFKNSSKVNNLRDVVVASCATARAAYDKNFSDYKATFRTADRAIIENLILETYQTSQSIADLIKNTNNFLDYIQDLMSQYQYKATPPSAMTTHQNYLDNYIGKVNGNLTSLLSIKQTIENSKQSIVNAERTIAEKTQSLAKLKSGADALDIQSQQISIQQKENAIIDAKEKLADYFVRAPFDGIVAKLDAKKGNEVSSGGAIATFITKQSLAVISLNEIDVAKVKVGQKTIIAFDAIDDLSITGEVLEIDTLGTTSQGVVSYNVKIAFDTQDERIKSGMSISTTIILSSKPDVLMVPSSAVKSQGDSNYVEILVNGVPENKTVTIGSANDTMMEVTSGLNEGDVVITQKITTGVAAVTNITATQGGARTGQPGGDTFRMLR